MTSSFFFTALLSTDVVSYANWAIHVDDNGLFSRLHCLAEGALQSFHFLALKQIIVLCCMLYITNADIPNSLFEATLVLPSRALLATPVFDLSPSNSSPFRKRHRKYFSRKIAPAQSPDYGPLVTSHAPSSSGLSKPSMKKNMTDISPTGSVPGTFPDSFSQPPLSPHASGCCGPDMVLKRGTEGCHCAYPIKIDLLLLNVSSNPNWRTFLEEFAAELGVRGSQINLIDFYVVAPTSYNISMDITPHTELSFSKNDESAINYKLFMHKVRLNPSLVGDYKLLNLTWFKPPAPSEAPVRATSPTLAPPHLPSSPKPPVTATNGKKPNLHVIIGIGFGVLILSIFVVIMICFYSSKQGKRKTSTEETKESLMFRNEISEKPRTVDVAPTTGSLRHPTSTRFLAYEELREATNNFEASSLLGEGGFGRVFKGVLSDGTNVAIKRLTSGGMQGDKEFLVEVEMLSRLHHRNLVKLVGYYTNRDSSQNLLCYELVPNGSLEAWLHGPLGLNCPLDWDNRMKIALDAARGLAYLHEDSQPCVIHRDFKASNILLENNFNAKVADFGLAKQAPEGRQTHLSTRVMGTFGYVAPEYAMTGHLLVKSDVYSYGVVLLELLTGRKPVDMSQPSGQENLVTWVLSMRKLKDKVWVNYGNRPILGARPILRDKDRLEELGDPRIEGKYPKDDYIRVCTIAAACVSPEASQRPTMGEVVQSLKMVQRVTEYQDSVSVNTKANIRQSPTTFESDGTSSMFSSSGPLSGFSAYDNENLARTGVCSEDLHEGR